MDGSRKHHNGLLIAITSFINVDAFTLLMKHINWVTSSPVRADGWQNLIDEVMIDPWKEVLDRDPIFI